jgi:hypothetical protein
MNAKLSSLDNFQSPLFETMPELEPSTFELFEAMDVTSNFPPEFFEAIHAQNIEKLEEIIKTQHIDLNQPTEFWSPSHTPLHIAANSGYVNVTKLFLEYNANPNIVSEIYNQTPLHIADNIKVAELLIGHGADLTLINKGGMTPYQSHASSGCYIAIREEIAHVIEDAMKLKGIAYTSYDCNEL